MSHPLAWTLFATLAVLPPAARPQTQESQQSRLPFPLLPVRVGPDGALALEAAPEQVAALAARKQVVLDQVPLPDAGEVSLGLHRLELSREDSLLVIDGRPRPLSEVAEHVQLWSGSVLGDPGSFCFLALSPFGTRGVIRTGGASYHLSAAGGADAVIFDGASGRAAGFVAGQAGPPRAGCASATIEQPRFPSPGALFQSAASGAGPDLGFSGNPLYEARIAIETDYQFYQLFNDSDQAAAYVLTVMGAASAIYEAQCTATFSLPYVGLHTGSNDGWSSPDGGYDTADLLYEFRAAWKNGGAPAAAHLYHFLSGADLGGGIAFIDVLCDQSYGFGVSANLNGDLTLPVTGPAPWDLEVVAHELGHNFSSPHTHSYCPPLDQCAPNGYFGICQSSQVCIPNGTIMSYCHLCPGGLGNIELVFHDTVASTIRNAVLNSCLEPAPPDDELCVDQPLGIHTELDPLISTQAIATVTLGNCGDSGAILSFTATLTTPAPWLTLSAWTGTAGPSPTPVSLIHDATGLDRGLHSTVVHFENDADPADFVDLPVTLLVLAPSFIAGDLLTGAVDSAGDVDRAGLEGLKKLKLKLRIDHGAGSAPLTVELLDWMDQEVATWTVKPGEVVRKKRKLPETGSYTLRVSGSGSAAGAFSIQTGARFPGKARRQVLKKVRPIPEGNYADVRLQALSGATLSVEVRPRASVQGPLLLMLFGPGDSPIDLAGQVAGDGLSFSGVSLPETGAYRLRISGFQSAAEKVKVIITPDQPAGGGSLVID